MYPRLRDLVSWLFIATGKNSCNLGLIFMTIPVILPQQGVVLHVGDHLILLQLAVSVVPVWMENSRNLLTKIIWTTLYSKVIISL